jgi:hypothetical protein
VFPDHSDYAVIKDLMWAAAWSKRQLREVVNPGAFVIKMFGLPEPAARRAWDLIDHPNHLPSSSDPGKLQINCCSMEINGALRKV